MSWKEQTQYFPWIQKYSIKLPHYQMQCTFCENKYLYVKIDKFKKHLLDKHKDVHLYESRRNNKVYWKYFKLTGTIRTQCVLCKKIVPYKDIDNLMNHTKRHSEQNLESIKTNNNLITQHWAFKYVKQRQDFGTYCTLCGTTSVVFELRTDSFKYHLQTKHGINNNELLTLKPRSWAFYTHQNSWLKKCFTNVKDFRAECIFCETKVRYGDPEKFTEHVKKFHSNAYLFEETHKNCIKIKHFRFTKENKIQCIICLESMEVLFWTKHIRQHTIQKKTVKGREQHWSWKYMKMTQDKSEDQNSVKCYLCDRSVKVIFHIRYLERHISQLHSEEWNKVKEKDLRVEQEAANDLAKPSTNWQAS